MRVGVRSDIYSRTHEIKFRRGFAKIDGRFVDVRKIEEKWQDLKEKARVKEFLSDAETRAKAEIEIGKFDLLYQTMSLMSLANQLKGPELWMARMVRLREEIYREMNTCTYPRVPRPCVARAAAADDDIDD